MSTKGKRTKNGTRKMRRVKNLRRMLTSIVSWFAIMAFAMVLCSGGQIVAVYRGFYAQHIAVAMITSIIATAGIAGCLAQKQFRKKGKIKGVLISVSIPTWSMVLCEKAEVKALCDNFYAMHQVGFIIAIVLSTVVATCMFLKVSLNSLRDEIESLRTIIEMEEKNKNDKLKQEELERFEKERHEFIMRIKSYGEENPKETARRLARENSLLQEENMKLIEHNDKLEKEKQKLKIRNSILQSLYEREKKKTKEV